MIVTFTPENAMNVYKELLLKLRLSAENRQEEDFLLIEFDDPMVIDIATQDLTKPRMLLSISLGNTCYQTTIYINTTDPDRSSGFSTCAPHRLTDFPLQFNLRIRYPIESMCISIKGERTYYCVQK